MTGAARITVTLEPTTGSPAIRVDGTLPAGAAGELRSLVRRAADLGGSCVRLELAGCERVDPEVRVCLAEEARRLRHRGGQLVCAGLPDLAPAAASTGDGPARDQIVGHRTPREEAAGRR